jgi:decaprenylphospho-beta-D-erythro-pentofuranosid-2-ulose 2-reductase
VGAVQSVLVLGGTSEIGVAIARRLVEGRARKVVLAARDPARVTAADELRGAGAEVDVVAFDARDTGSHERFAAEVFERHGDIDLVLVAFGVLGEQQRAEREPEHALEVVETNYTGAVSALLPLVERLRRQWHGTVVVLSSVAGERVRKSNFVYGSSKAAIDGFAQGLGDALAGSGVHVLVVRPGFVRTKMTEGLDEPPFTTGPEAVAEAVADGLRRRAHTVWSPPVLRYVMAVLRHLPRPLFRRLDI